MGFYVDEENFAHGQAPVTGILLVNLGTPDAPTFGALRRYLKQFLEDPRVVELPRPLWWLILNGIVLNVRPGRSAAKYRKIWTAEGAPLRVYTRRLGEAVAARLKADCAGPVEVAVGMRYGNPSIAAALDRLRRAGARRLLVLPLYPQYSAATTASTFDAVAEELMTWRWLPELRMISHYHDDPGYLEAVTASILEIWTQQGQPQRLLFSFHGLPRRNLLAGDPYHCQCHKTARRVAETLDLEPQRWAVAFQSRFGYAEWLKPYTSELLADWGRQGVKAVDVVCPGFAVDCLETLEEIADENAAVYLGAGGGQFRYIPALNDSLHHAQVLADLLRAHGSGWPELAAEADASAPESLAASRRRALAMGAQR